MKNITSCLILAVVVIGAAISLAWADLSNRVTSDPGVSNNPASSAWQAGFYTEIPPGASHDTIHVKFKEGSGVRLRDGEFISLTGENLLEVNYALRAHLVTRIERVFERSEVEIEQERKQVEATTGRKIPDKNLWYRIVLESESDTLSLLNLLNAIAIVQEAFPPTSPRTTTPSASSNYKALGYQGYLDPAPRGIDAWYAWQQNGGTGQFVKIIDIEFAWNESHEDLTTAVGGLIANGTPAIPRDQDPSFAISHGTAVLGEMVAGRNDFGVTGIAHDADVGMVNVFDGAQMINKLAAAIDIAAGALVAGDVIVIPLGVSGPGCPSANSSCVPVEWQADNYEAIVGATAKGITVVETAGNIVGGENDLDDEAYGSPFPGRQDSEAIIAGGGAAPECTCAPRGRLGSAVYNSSYGSRVNLQGWGECVTTTGGNGDLYYNPRDPSDINQQYTWTFNGTSSAGPIVAAAAAVVSSVAKGSCRTWAPSEIRDLLVATGTPQDLSCNGGHVGPMPDLQIALRVLLGRIFHTAGWPQLQYEDPGTSFGDAEWLRFKDSRVVQQLWNSDASILLSSVDASQSAIRGTWRVEDCCLDDDLIGFVFGYQDSGHFYLFDWKKADQCDPLGFAAKGMSLKRISKDVDPSGEDLWPTAVCRDSCPCPVTTGAISPYVHLLQHNAIAWEPGVDYEYTLQYLDGYGGFRIEVFEADTHHEQDTLLASWVIADETYPTGRFGFYNYSQANVIYTGGRDVVADCDGDGSDQMVDCANNDPFVFPGVEVNDGLDNTCPDEFGFGVADELSEESGFEGPNVYSWPAQPGATTYEVARATDKGFYVGCTLSQTSNTFIVDSTESPAGQVFYYLVRAIVPNVGSWGQDSTGTERVLVGCV